MITHGNKRDLKKVELKTETLKSRQSKKSVLGFQFKIGIFLFIQHILPSVFYDSDDVIFSTPLLQSV